MKKLILLFTCILLSLSSTAQVNLSSGLIACYPFSGNAADMSGNNNNGVVLGPVLTSDRFGNSNSAYDFDGVDDYINLGLLNNITSSNSFSFSVWIKPKLVKIQTLLMLMPDYFTDRLNAMAFYSHNGLSSTFWDFGNCTQGGRLFQGGTALSTLWQHFVYTVDPLGGMKVYENGILSVSITTSSSLINRQRQLWIGGGQDQVGAQFYWLGKLDDIRIYDRQLNSAEVLALYNLTSSCDKVSIGENEIPDHQYHVNFSEGILSLMLKPGAPISDFSLFSADGKLVYEIHNLQSGENRIVLFSGRNAGMYIYKFQSASGLVSGKVIVP
jgi:hypothetical protein